MGWATFWAIIKKNSSGHPEEEFKMFLSAEIGPGKMANSDRLASWGPSVPVVS
jgi:hypothetical protein